MSLSYSPVDIKWIIISVEVVHRISENIRKTIFTLLFSF